MTKNEFEKLKTLALAATEMGYSEFPSFSGAVVLDLIARVEGMQKVLERLDCGVYESSTAIARAALESFGVK